MTCGIPKIVHLLSDLLFHLDMWYNLSNTSEPSKFPQENSTDSYLWYDGGKLPQGFILQQNFKQTPNRNVLAPQLQVQYFNWGNPTRPRDYPITHASYMGLVNGQMPYTPYPRQPLPNVVSQSYVRSKTPYYLY